MSDTKKIAVCESHSDYKVPMIDTMVFSGAEAWCPYCGKTAGMFDVSIIESTPELEERKRVYALRSKAFLRATGVFSASQVKYQDQWLTLAELPIEFVDEQKEIARQWKYNVEAEGGEEETATTS